MTKQQTHPEILSYIRRFLVDHYNLDELKDLAFDLGIAHDRLTHDTRDNLARELVAYFDRHDNLSYLLDGILEKYPDTRLEQILNPLPAPTRCQKVQIILRDGVDKLRNEPELRRKLAQLFGVPETELEIVAAAAGSIRLLLGLPQSSGEQVRYPSYFEYAEEGRYLEGTKYRIISIIPFQILDQFSQSTWRLLNRYAPPTRQKDDLLPTISWQEITIQNIHHTRNLSGANLGGADLHGVNLNRADLRGANLNLANLCEANLNGADLSQAYLSGANLSWADLRGANLHEAKLNRADLGYAKLSRADLGSADLNGADLGQAYLNEAYLSRAYLSRAYLRWADLRWADLNGADLSQAYLSGANLSGANLSGASLSGTYLGGVDLSGADLNGADLNGADLNGANLSGANLSGASLSRSNLSEAQYDQHTAWSPDFDPRAHDAVLVKD